MLINAYFYLPSSAAKIAAAVTMTISGIKLHNFHKQGSAIPGKDKQPSSVHLVVPMAQGHGARFPQTFFG